MLQRKLMDSRMKGKGIIPPTQGKCHQPRVRQCLEVTAEQNVVSPQKAKAVDWINLCDGRKGLEG